MDARANHRNELRAEIAKLQALVDAQVAEGLRRDDRIFCACKRVLRERKTRLEQLQQPTA